MNTKNTTSNLNLYIEVKEEVTELLKTDSKPELITQTDLLSRGWTKKTIKLFYPTPDLLKRNPNYSPHKMKLFNLENVKKIEDSQEFKDFRIKNQKRVDGAYQAIETKFDKTIEYVENYEFEVPILEKDELYEMAIESYNERKMDRNNFDNLASMESDGSFLRRIATNFIRHELTNYESVLDYIQNKVGNSYAYSLMREKMDKKIKEVYPYLK